MSKFPEKDFAKWQRETVYSDPESAFDGGYRSGLREAARMASATAGRIPGSSRKLDYRAARELWLEFAARVRRLAEEDA